MQFVLVTKDMLDKGRRSMPPRSLGGVDLIIPRDWRVTVRGTPILGGVSNLPEGSSLPDDAPRLRVDALAILGGVEIKHDK